MAQSEWVRWGGLAAMGAQVLAILYFLLSLAAGKGVNWAQSHRFSRPER